MPAIGMGLGWLGYTITLYGVALLKGWDITFGQLISPTHPYGSRAGQKWPPASLPSTVVVPGGAGSAVTTAAKTTSAVKTV